MAFDLPPFKFDSSLKDSPLDKDEWSAFITALQEKLQVAPGNIETKLEIYEHLGIALRIAHRFDEAEAHLSKALALSDSPSKQVQNLIRLAHVYQWEMEFRKAKALFDQARHLLNEANISANLTAAYHQHLGKFYFDQDYMGLAISEFELALKIRNSLDAPKDQIESTKLALVESRK